MHNIYMSKTKLELKSFSKLQLINLKHNNHHKWFKNKIIKKLKIWIVIYSLILKILMMLIKLLKMNLLKNLKLKVSQKIRKIITILKYKNLHLNKKQKKLINIMKKLLTIVPVTIKIKK